MYGAEDFPDLELHLTAFLRSVLGSGWRVSNTTPETMTGPTVQVRLAGGQRTTQVSQTSFVAVNLWAETQKAANDAAALVTRELLANTPPPVEHVETAGLMSPIADGGLLHRRFGTFEVVASAT